MSDPYAPLDWRDVAPGAKLPEMVIDVTASVIVAGAIATRDFMPVHHDREYTNAQGSSDIFMNILSDAGFCGRYLTDWAGYEARVTKLAIRLGVPVFPGAVLTYRGEVTAVARDGDLGRIEVEFHASTELGEHLGGTATLDVPVAD